MPSFIDSVVGRFIAATGFDIADGVKAQAELWDTFVVASKAELGRHQRQQCRRMTRPAHDLWSPTTPLPFAPSTSVCAGLPTHGHAPEQKAGPLPGCRRSPICSHHGGRRRQRSANTRCGRVAKPSSVQILIVLVAERSRQRYRTIALGNRT